MVDEKILVVPARKLFPHERPTGFIKQDPAFYQGLIAEEQTFIWRKDAEEDPNFKQIIPYLLFAHGDKLFMMQRRANANEKRLQSKFSLGIGGHIREEDMQDGDSLAEWAQREFHEEVDYKGNLEVIPLGLINDESNPVGQVHTGFTFLLKGDSSYITIKEEHLSGELVPFDKCLDYYDRMESWSVMLFDHIKENKALLD
jgi:predicted NUDIX family phosphoesterase